MNAFKYELSIIGLLIQYYRKESRLNLDELLYDEGNYYKEYCLDCNKCTNPKQICSRKTYYKIAKGESVNNECVYHRLAERLGKKIVFENDDIYERIKKYHQLLEKYLVVNDRTNLEKLEAAISYDLMKYENTIYAYEILSLYNDVIKERLYFSIPKDFNVSIYLYLKNYLQSKDQKFILLLLTKTSYKLTNFSISHMQAAKDCEKFFQDPIFYQVKLVTITYGNLLDAYNELMTNEFPKIDSLNEYQKYCLYDALAYIQMNIDAFEGCYSSYKKCLEIIEKNNFGTILIRGINLQLGRVCYLLKNYDATIEYLVLGYNVSKALSKDYPILFSAFEKTNQHHKITEYLSKVDYSKIKTVYPKKALAYYKMKYTYDMNNIKNVVELENYICSTLKPYLEMYGSLHRNIFLEDLEKYVTITGNYKKYYLFNKKES